MLQWRNGVLGTGQTDPFGCLVLLFGGLINCPPVKPTPRHTRLLYKMGLGMSGPHATASLCFGGQVSVRADPQPPSCETWRSVGRPHRAQSVPARPAVECSALAGSLAYWSLSWSERRNEHSPGPGPVGPWRADPAQGPKSQPVCGIEYLEYGSGNVGHSRQFITPCV
jgi:hypothetical protein